MMKTKFKKIAMLCLAVGMLLALSGCDLGGVSKKDATIFIQGEMDCAFLGQVSDEYLKILEMDEAEALEFYDWNVSEQARLMLEYFSVEYPDDAIVERSEELTRQIYAKSKYEVGDAEKMSDGNFTATVKIWPIDILMQITDEELQDIWSEASAGYSSDISDAQYEELDRIYATQVLDLLESRIPNIGYEKEQSCALRLLLDESDDTFYMSDTDWQNMDQMIVDFYGYYA